MDLSPAAIKGEPTASFSARKILSVFPASAPPVCSVNLRKTHTDRPGCAGMPNTVLAGNRAAIRWNV